MTAIKKRTTKQVRISLEAIDMTDFMCERSNQSRQEFLEQVIKEIFGIACSFKSFKLAFTSSVLDNKVEIEVIGDSLLRIGEFKVSEKILTLKGKKVRKK